MATCEHCGRTHPALHCMCVYACSSRLHNDDRFLEQVGHAVLDPVSPARSSTRMCTPCLVPISTCLTRPTRDSRVAGEHSDASHISAPTTLPIQAGRLIACMNFELLHDSPGQHVSSSTRTLTRSHAHTLTRSHAHTLTRPEPLSSARVSRCICDFDVAPWWCIAIGAALSLGTEQPRASGVSRASYAQCRTTRQSSHTSTQ